MPLRNESKRKWPLHERKEEIDKVCDGFVATGKSNRSIYRVIIEALFPEGSGLPGPVLSRNDIREAVQKARPRYQDPFRRLRELQGEEGLHGLVRDKSKYQLQTLAVEKKRTPRRSVSSSTARKIALAQNSRCPTCGDALVLDGDSIHVDHKVPRDRGGSNDEANLQVLCGQCNVMKSSQCSGCNLPCQVCPWAFPEKYRLPRIRQDIVQRLNDQARAINRSVDDLTNEVLERGLREHE